MKKILKLSLLILLISTSAFAGSDGENELSQKSFVRSFLESIRQKMYNKN